MSDFYKDLENMVAKPGDHYVGIFRFDENMKKVFVEGVACDSTVCIATLFKDDEPTEKF